MEKKRRIKLDQDQRRIKEFFKFDNVGIDATVVEILPEDDISDDYFLLPNYDYMYNFERLKLKKVTILQYPKDYSLCYSDGIIIDIKNYELTHFASSLECSSGSPIILKDTETVIGIHKCGLLTNQNYFEIRKNYYVPKNYGDCIGPIYQYFNPQKVNKPKANKLNNFFY